MNKITNEPIPKVWCTILKNKDVYADFARTNAKGVGSFTLRNYDSTATYQVEIFNRDSNFVQSGMFDITSMKNSQPIVKVMPADDSMPYGCGEVIYIGYHPKEPYSLNELPKFIQKKVKQYFIDRVGIEFYKKLVLNGGQILNLERFYKTTPQARTNGWVPPEYSLCFMVWDKIRHLTYYNFKMELDGKGNLKKPIPLPDIKHEPLKAKIIDLDEAKEIAKQNDFFSQYMESDSYYYPKAGSIVWEFSQHEPGPGKVKLFKILIDAHSGRIVDRLTSDITVSY